MHSEPTFTATPVSSFLQCHISFNIAKNPKYDGYQRGLASMVYKFFDRKSASLTDMSASGSDVNIPLEFNEQLAKELQTSY